MGAFGGVFYPYGAEGKVARNSRTTLAAPAQSGALAYESYFQQNLTSASLRLRVA